MAQFSDADPNDPESFTAFGAPRCQAANARGERCGRPAAKFGGGTCHKHGASAPNSQVAIARRKAEDEARRRLAKILPDWEQDPEAVGNPVQAMAVLAGRNRHLHDHIWAMLEPKDHDCAHCGCSVGLDAGMLSLYTQSEKALRNSLGEMARMKLGERLVDLEEVKVTMFAMALAAAIEEVLPDINWVQMGNVKSAFLKKLDELEKAAPEPHIVRMQ